MEVYSSNRIESDEYEKSVRIECKGIEKFYEIFSVKYFSVKY